MIPSPDSFLPWWYDEFVQSYFQTWQGVVSLVLGFITLRTAGWVAAWQFRIMDKQTKMMEEQTEISKRQEAIALTQGEIAAFQHSFLMEQLANRPRVDLMVTGMDPLDARVKLTITARNGGKAPANGFGWEIVLPIKVRPFVEFLNEHNKGAEHKFTVDFRTKKLLNYFVKGIHDRRLFVGDMVDVAAIAVDRRDFEEFDIEWRTYGEFATEPTSGYNTVHVIPKPQGLPSVVPVLMIP